MIMDINVSYVFQWEVTEPEKETVQRVAEYNVTNKMSNYINKMKQNEDTQVFCKIVIEKNKKRYFNGSFVLSAAGAEDLRYEREDFRELSDLVAHAFDHFKEKLASA